MDKSDRHLRIFTDGKAAFGYQLNVGNTALGALYEYYIYANKIYRPMGDAARIKWERELWKYLQKVYYSCYKTHLPDYPNPDGASLKDLVVGWQYEQLFDIINYRINIAKAIDKLYKKLPQAVETPEGAENRTNYYYNLSISHTRKKVKV